MTADSTDREALARVLAGIMVAARRLPENEPIAWGMAEDAADAVIEHLDATGPARDEGLRANGAKWQATRATMERHATPHSGGVHGWVNRLREAHGPVVHGGLWHGCRCGEPLCPSSVLAFWIEGLYLDIERRRQEFVQETLRTDAALAASPAPGGDTAPREDGLRCGKTPEQHDMWGCACWSAGFDEAVKSWEAAWPARPGRPAATRDGEICRHCDQEITQDDNADWVCVRTTGEGGTGALCIDSSGDHDPTDLSGTFPDGTDEGERHEHGERRLHSERAEPGPRGEPGRERPDQGGRRRDDSDSVRRAPQGQPVADVLQQAVSRLRGVVRMCYPDDLTPPAKMLIDEAIDEVAASVPDSPLAEWKCPNCGATTRARMADHDH